MCDFYGIFLQAMLLTKEETENKRIRIQVRVHVAKIVADTLVSTAECDPRCTPRGRVCSASGTCVPAGLFCSAHSHFIIIIALQAPAHGTSERPWECPFVPSSRGAAVFRAVLSRMPPLCLFPGAVPSAQPPETVPTVQACGLSLQFWNSQ